MATSRKRVRYTFDVHFLTTEEKDAFVQRLNNVRRLLTSAGSPLLDNFSLMSAFVMLLRVTQAPVRRLLLVFAQLSKLS